MTGSDRVFVAMLAVLLVAALWVHGLIVSHHYDHLQHCIATVIEVDNTPDC